MGNFEKACVLSADRWVTSLPLEPEVHPASKRFLRRMDRILDKMRYDTYHRLTRTAMKTLLVAAIILSIAVTAVASPAARDFIIKKFSTHSTYSVKEGYSGKTEAALTLDYVPEGFVKTDEVIDDYNSYYKYTSANGRWFKISKQYSNGIMGFDTEKYEQKEVNYNGIQYVFYQSSSDNTVGILWNLDGYIYNVDGNLKEEEIFNIAKCTK